MADSAPDLEYPSGSDAKVTRTFATALSALAASQKSSRGAPAYSRFVNRKLGRILAAAAWVLKATPNQVTLASAILTFGAIGLIAAAPPTVLVSICITGLLIVGYALDAADGQLARLGGGGSLVGEWLDHVVDAVKSSTLHGAVLISWFRFFDVDDRLLLVPLGYQAITAVFFFAMILSDLLRRLNRGSQSIIIRETGAISPLYSLAVIPADYGLICLIFLVFWWPPVFIFLYSLLFVANALIALAALVRWFREMKTLS